MKKALPVACLILLGLFWLAVALPVAAQPPGQGAVVSTPTAGADGRIVYTVKPNDTCISISLLMNVPIDQLRKLNNLNTECVLQVGQQLLLAVITPQPSATPGAAATATSLLPTQTLFSGTGQVCVLLYEDVNGDATRTQDEASIPDGAVSLTERSGKYSQSLTTSAGDQPVCFSSVPEGDYNISVAVPEGYNPTTALNYPLKVQAGDQTVLDFGAQLNSKAAPVPVSEGGRSPILGILGGVLLLFGAGLGLYVRQARK